VRIAHLADLHLGFRQFAVNAPNGMNQREADVQLAYSRAIDGVLEAKPDLIVLAGDIFHSVRPPNTAILFLFRQLQRIRMTLPTAPIVMISGDHDTPRSSEAASILGLYRDGLGVTVVQAGIERVRLPGATVTAVPKPWARQAGELEPEPDVTNILLLHGEARNLPGRQVDLAAVTAHRWNYVALGHYHVCQELAPRVWYAGSLDYTSTDPWAELREQTERRLPGKGWILADTETGAVTFRPIEPPRKFYDVEPIDGTGRSGAQIVADLGYWLDALGPCLDGAVVRLHVLGVSRETQRALDQATIRRWKARALNLQIGFTRPVGEAVTPEGRRERLHRLDLELDDFLTGRELPDDVDRAELRKLGQQYLADASTGEE